MGWQSQCETTGANQRRSSSAAEEDQESLLSRKSDPSRSRSRSRKLRRQTRERMGLRTCRKHASRWFAQSRRQAAVVESVLSLVAARMGFLSVCRPNRLTRLVSIRRLEDPWVRWCIRSLIWASRPSRSCVLVQHLRWARDLSTRRRHRWRCGFGPALERFVSGLRRGFSSSCSLTLLLAESFRSFLLCFWYK